MMRASAIRGGPLVCWLHWHGLRHYRRKLAEDALSTVSQKLIEAHEEESSRIARELHDDINQRLAMVSVRLGYLKQSPPLRQPNSRGRSGESAKRLRILRPIFRRCRTAFTPRNWNS